MPIPLVIRSQSLALHAEGVAEAVGPDGSANQPVEFRVQVLCDGIPAKDEANSASYRDGSSWALLSKDGTVKLSYSDAKSGHFIFPDDAGMLEFRVLSRRQGSADTTQTQLVAVACLDAPAALHAKGRSLNELALASPNTTAREGPVAPAGSRKRANGVLLVKVSLPASRPTAAEAASAAPEPVSSSMAANVPQPAPPPEPPVAQAAMPADFPPSTPANTASAATTTASATQRAGGGAGGTSGGSVSVADMERLRREVEAEEKAVAAARAEAERLESELEASRGETHVLVQELEHAKDSLRGTRKADFKAHKLHVLDRQARQLTLQLQNTHQAIANAMDEREAEEQHCHRLMVSAAA